MKTIANQEKKQILNQKAKPILTSCSIPSWQKYRIAYTKRRLQNKIDKAGMTYRVVEGEIEVLALKLFIRQVTPRTHSAERAVLYNRDRPCYTKVNVYFKNEADYLLMIAKRMYLRVSVSYLMDLALRIYLEIAASLLFAKVTGSKLCQRCFNLFNHFSNYKEKVNKDRKNGLIIAYNVNWGVDSS